MEIHDENREVCRTDSVDVNTREPPDPYAIGEAKLAEFWPAYVKEADTYDRELFEGWNKMLDVILGEAALFSAISTAFVLESSKDLKPDPAESAAATLLIMSQTLLAISNQSIQAPTITVSDTSTFIAPKSAVVVNILWFMSLILSISVTLVAMLAKEWSHLFMAGRTGLPQEQARRRQNRFDAMNDWKMAGVITALPTLMHLALCEFFLPIHIFLQALIG
ncbi:hypothetical protein BDV93DRAFT_501423 [Ceratobasidium sp. AG-I]|nr:hypothetical protein BDV93DRAFT_501423 [Ceratobasidium sp. AG-I]